MDEDGDLDVVLANLDIVTGNVAWATNGLADLNHDGAPDVIEVNNGTRNRLFLGRLYRKGDPTDERGPSRTMDRDRH